MPEAEVKREERIIFSTLSPLSLLLQLGLFQSWLRSRWSNVVVVGTGALLKLGGSCWPAIGKTLIAMGLVGFFIRGRANKEVVVINNQEQQYLAALLLELKKQLPCAFADLLPSQRGLLPCRKHGLAD